MGFLTGKTAIITGAGRAVLSDGRCGSIGYGIATAYAKEGANIVITGRNESKLAAAKEELEKLYNIKVLTIQADVNASADNEAVVANVVKQTIDTFGHIDVLINNAQASASGVPLAEHTTEQFNLAICIALTFFILLLPAPNAVYIIAVIAVTHNNTHITIETITFLCFQLIPMSAPFTFPLLLYSFYCVLYTLIKLFYSKISFNPSDNN